VSAVVEAELVVLPLVWWAVLVALVLARTRLQ
jgi:hypothetical protein